MPSRRVVRRTTPRPSDRERLEPPAVCPSGLSWERRWCCWAQGLLPSRPPSMTRPTPTYCAGTARSTLVPATSATSAHTTRRPLHATRETAGISRSPTGSTPRASPAPSTSRRRGARDGLRRRSRCREVRNPSATRPTWPSGLTAPCRALLRGGWSAALRRPLGHGAGRDDPVASEHPVRSGPVSRRRHDAHLLGGEHDQRPHGARKRNP